MSIGAHLTDVTQLQDALIRVFDEEKQRLVFWNDPEGEFQGSLADLALDGLETLKLDEHPALELKIRLQQETRKGATCSTPPTEEPDYADDWLLDVRLYSRSFRADRASILLDELGLVRQHLRAHIARRRKFFQADRLTWHLGLAGSGALVAAALVSCRRRGADRPGSAAHPAG